MTIYMLKYYFFIPMFNMRSTARSHFANWHVNLPLFAFLLHCICPSTHPLHIKLSAVSMAVLLRYLLVADVWRSPRRIACIAITSSQFGPPPYTIVGSRLANSSYTTKEKDEWNTTIFIFISCKRKYVGEIANSRHDDFR